MKKAIVIIGTIFICFTSLGQQQLITQGDSAYNREAYTDAIGFYEDVLGQGYESAELYYNLGNAYFNINKLPEAILNYERAKVLAPSDNDISFNLNIANSMIPDKIEAVPEIFYVRWWKSLRDSVNLHTWTITSLLIFAMLILSAGTFFLSRNIFMRKLSFWAGMVLILIGIGALAVYILYEKTTCSP